MRRTRRNYRTTRDIVIPAGTILLSASHEHGGTSYRETSVALGSDFTATFIVQAHPDALASDFIEEIK